MALPQISLNTDAAEAKSRIVLVSLISFTLRLTENWRRLQQAVAGRDLDHDSVAILNAIVVIGGQQLLYTPIEGPLENLANPLPYDRLRKCTISSISAATGLNRETARRRVQQLEEMGLVIREEDGGVRPPHGTLQRIEVRETLSAQMNLISRTVNDLARHGVIEFR